MNRLYKILGIAVLGAVLFSSCSKKKYTASFAPSKQKVWNKVAIEEAKQTLSTEKVTNEASEENVMASADEKATPVIESNIVKSTRVDEKVTQEEVLKPAFTKAEKKATKKQLRKAVIKSAFKKKSGGDINILAVILSLFPILCLIGIYIHQGSITNDFWLDLVLHLTFIGEIIYALLVTLNLFSIA